MDGIVKNAMSRLIHKSSAKTELLETLKSSMNIEWQVTYGIDSVIEYMTDTWIR
jgi:hypothetical protein